MPRVQCFARLPNLLLAILVTVCLTAPEPTLAAPSLQPPPPDASAERAAAFPNFSHIFVVVMENKEIGRMLGNRQAPYLNQLANEYAVATRYYAVTHPSLPNYLALLGGDTFGVSENCMTVLPVRF